MTRVRFVSVLFDIMTKVYMNIELYPIYYCSILLQDTDPWKDVGGGRRLDGKPKNNQGNGHRPLHELTEEEQLQAAIEASMMDNVDTNRGSSSSSDGFVAELLSINVKDEPVNGARVQIRMPGGAKFVRKFNGDDPVKVIYAFVAVSFWFIKNLFVSLDII